LGLPGALRRCLCTTNVIESPNSGIRRRTGRVSRWKNGSMVLRWVASALIETEKSFRRIMGWTSCGCSRPFSTILRKARKLLKNVKLELIL